MALFVGRLSSQTKKSDLESLFNKYGNLKRCELRNNFAFISIIFILFRLLFILAYNDEKDAEDALKELNGKEIDGNNINIEWTKESGRQAENPSYKDKKRDDRECFNCKKLGHISRYQVYFNII